MNKMRHFHVQLITQAIKARHSVPARPAPLIKWTAQSCTDGHTVKQQAAEGACQHLTQFTLGRSTNMFPTDKQTNLMEQQLELMRGAVAVSKQSTQRPNEPLES